VAHPRAVRGALRRRPADIARTRAWLAEQGLDVRATSPLGTRVSFGGTVAQIGAAFRTEVRRYEVAGEMHYAMASAPAVPGDLAGVVLAVHNSHDFFPKPAIHAAPVRPDFRSAGLMPSDWANIYDVASLYKTGVAGSPIDGAGVTIGVVGVAQIAQSDVDAFRSTAGLPASSVTMTLVPNTGLALGGSNGTGVEATLDVEWSGGIAPGAKIDYVFTGADDGNVDDATYFIIENKLAPIISESWGGCEQGLSASDADVVGVYGSAANVLGITYVAATGDSGATGCGGAGKNAGLYVSIPAAFPGVTAVGGTQFPGGSLTYDASGTATGYGTVEQVWNESSDPQQGVAAGAGGVSVVFSRPAYQTTTCTMVGSLPVAGVTASGMRQVPDLSFSAASGSNPYYIECTPSGTTMDCSNLGGAPRSFGIGGTSASTPSFAGVVALLEQIAGEPLGNINPLLYALDATAFHDITQGDNEVACVSGTDPGCPAAEAYGYPATMGYDCASGIGSMDVAKVATAVSAMARTTTALVATPATTSEGTPIGLTATVGVPAPNGSAVSGVVTFAFQAYLTDGAPDLSWTLGTSTLAGAMASGGTATLSTPIPPGLVDPSAQYVDVVATYGGDPGHLPSTSAKVRVSFAALSLAVSPTTATVPAGGTVQFTSTGGVAPIRWYVGADTTCDMNNDCSAVVATTGAFTAGPQPGTTQVAAIDADGAEALATVTVTAGPDAGPPDAGGPADGGGDGAAADGAPDDAGAATDGPATAADGGDAGAAGAPSKGGGCGCAQAGAENPSLTGLAGLALAAGGVARRRKVRRSRPLR
jgi:hypothetical protein